MSDTDITLDPSEWSVSAKETVSTGDYENAELFASVSGDIPEHVDLDGDTRTELKARLLAVEKTMQSVVERGASNRVAVPDEEDWGVRSDDGGQA